MPVFILVGKVVLLICIKSVLIMSFPARTINKTSLKFFSPNDCVNNFHVWKPVDANIRPQGHRHLLTRPPRHFLLRKSPGAGHNFWCKSPGVSGGADGNWSNWYLHYLQSVCLLIKFLKVFKVTVDFPLCFSVHSSLEIWDFCGALVKQTESILIRTKPNRYWAEEGHVSNGIWHHDFNFIFWSKSNCMNEK